MADELEKGKVYVVTTKHTFAYPFSHYEKEGGNTVACFEEPGEGRFGKQYRKVVIGAENVHSILPVE